MPQQTLCLSVKMRFICARFTGNRFCLPHVCFSASKVRSGKVGRQPCGQLLVTGRVAKGQHSPSRTGDQHGGAVM